MDFTGGSITSAVLLAQMYNLAKITKHFKEEAPVVIRTHEEWAHVTGMSVGQVKRAIKILRDKKIIATFNAPHKYKTGTMKALHVVINRSFFDAFSGGQSVADDLSDVSLETDLYVAGDKLSLYKGDKKKKITGDDSSIGSDDLKKDNLGKEENMKFDKPFSMEELKQQQEKNQFEVKEEDFTLTKDSYNTSNECVKLWRYLFGKYHTQVMCETMTNKRKAHFKSMTKEYGYTPLDRSMKYVLANWLDFVQYVQEVTSRKDVSKMPDVDTFYKFRHHAIAFPTVHLSAKPEEEVKLKAKKKLKKL